MLNVENYDVIAIDEAQFFDDFQSFVRQNHSNKIIIASALSGDRYQRTFPNMIDAYAMAIDVRYLYAACVRCRQRQACFTVDRLIDKPVNQIVVIGGSERYDAVCNNCLLK
jgi:thymidine kinase